MIVAKIQRRLAETARMIATAAGGERVLIVDDEPDIRRAVHVPSRQSRLSGVDSGQSGRRRLRAAREERPALVVLDLMLPGMSGFDVLEQLRADDATRDIAVLMLTARREEPDRIRGLSLGADDYLTKPFSPQELVLRVGGDPATNLPAPRCRATDLLTVGPLQHRPRRHTACAIDGREIELTPTEYQAAADAGGTPRARAGASAPARDGVGRGARHSDAHRRHARAAPTGEARSRRRADRDGPRIRIPDPSRAATECVTASGRHSRATRSAAAPRIPARHRGHSRPGDRAQRARPPWWNAARDDRSHGGRRAPHRRTLAPWRRY